MLNIEYHCNCYTKFDEKSELPFLSLQLCIYLIIVISPFHKWSETKLEMFGSG